LNLSFSAFQKLLRRALLRSRAFQSAIIFIPFVLCAQQRIDPAPEISGKTTIKTEVRQVLLDVVVSNNENHPVSGLQAEDFSIFEDGKAQQILSFEPHTAELVASSRKSFTLPALPPNTFLNAPTGYEALPLNILLWDLLNTPVDSQPFAHKEIIKFLHSKPTGSRFAIFVLGDKLQLLHGFTDDERELVAAMNSQEAGSRSSTSQQSQDDVHAASTQLSDIDVLRANDANQQAILDRMQHMESVVGNYLLTQRVEKTINAFVNIADFVQGLPGRKNLIWLSGAFPAEILPGNDPTDPFGTSVTYSAELRQAAQLFTLGRIAVYPVDIRGLTVNPVFGAASARVYRSAGSFSDAHGRFSQQLDAEHATMDKIAEDSGGHAFYDTNGLQRAISTGINDGANYYTLSYSPTNKKFDGGLRKIRVVVRHSGYHLSYRHDYTAEENGASSKKTASAAPDPVEVAMRRGAPTAHDLVFEVHLAPQGDSVPVTPDQIRQLSRLPAFASQKAWDAVRIQRYLIDFAVLGKQISFVSAGTGTHKGKLEFLFAAYAADGSTMIGQRLKANANFSETDFEEVRKGAYRAQEVLDIPSSAAWLRLGVHDGIANRLGSLEIPLPLAREAQHETSASSH
jgi:VWFA-related protein